ncbi:hypothetical protein NKG05_01780 [Oerskovia sp. M15]
MVSWKQLADDAPDLAARVRARFEVGEQHVLATRTLTGSPRVSGTQVGFWEDQAWIGSTSRSGKSMDLRVDPRFALHSNPGDGSMSGGDAKVNGTARGPRRTTHARSGSSPTPTRPSRSTCSGWTSPRWC